MEIKVGNRVLLFSTTIMIPDGEEAFLSYEIAEGDLLNCCFKFKIESGDVSKEKKQGINLSFIDGTFIFEFQNFDSSFGHSTTNPVPFGLSNAAEPLLFLGNICKLKSFTKIEAQFMKDII